MNQHLFLLGSARSGTTLLGRTLLSNLKGITYLGEQNPLWMHGNAYKRDDVLTSDHATPSAKEYIRKKFETLSNSHPNTVLVDKTPANTLRVPFLRDIFPDARFIHLTRDGRDVTMSAAREWRGDGLDALDSVELRVGSFADRVTKGTSKYLKLGDRIRTFRDFMELPAYAPRYLAFLLRNRRTGRDYPWGPRFPDMAGYRKKHSLLETCAMQWVWQVRMALEAIETLPPSNCYSLSYESLISNPLQTLECLLSWIGFPHDSEQVKALASKVQSRPQSGNMAFEGLAKEEQVKIMEILAPWLLQLEYAF